MPEELQKLFAKAVFEKLAEKIRGKIYCHITNDELYVEITTVKDLHFDFTIKDVADKVHNGWTSEYAAYEVTKYLDKALCHIFYK